MKRIPEARSALRSSHLKRAIEASTAAIRQPLDVAIAYATRVLIRLQLGDLRRTIADCSERLEIDPVAASLYWLRGKAYLARCECRKAVDDFTSALVGDPASRNARLLRGAALIQLAAWDKANIVASSAILLGQYTQTADHLRNISLSAIGKFDQALAAHRAISAVREPTSAARTGSWLIGRIGGKTAKTTISLPARDGPHSANHQPRPEPFAEWHWFSTTAHGRKQRAFIAAGRLRRWPKLISSIPKSFRRFHVAGLICT